MPAPQKGSRGRGRAAARLPCIPGSPFRLRGPRTLPGQRCGAPRSPRAAQTSPKPPPSAKGRISNALQARLRCIYPLLRPRLCGTAPSCSCCAAPIPPPPAALLGSSPVPAVQIWVPSLGEKKITHTHTPRRSSGKSVLHNYQQTVITELPPDQSVLQNYHALCACQP